MLKHFHESLNIKTSAFSIKIHTLSGPPKHHVHHLFTSSRQDTISLSKTKNDSNGFSLRLIDFGKSLVNTKAHCNSPVRRWTSSGALCTEKPMCGCILTWLAVKRCDWATLRVRDRWFIHLLTKFFVFFAVVVHFLWNVSKAEAR